MCKMCLELEGRISHYRMLAAQITDQLTLDGIKELIDGLKAEKTALHPRYEISINSLPSIVSNGR